MPNPANDDHPTSTDTVQNLQAAHDAKIRECKRLIAQWLDVSVLRQSGTITLALLELGIERHLNLFPDEKSATDLVQGALRKVLERRRGPGQ